MPPSRSNAKPKASSAGRSTAARRSSQRSDPGQPTETRPDPAAHDMLEAQTRIAIQEGLLANVADAVVVIEPDGEIGYWNAGAEAIYGWRADEVVGHRWQDVVGQLLGPDEADRLRDVMRSKGHFRVETPQVLRDGTTAMLDITVTGAQGPDGAARYLLVGRDMTERRATEARLARRAEELVALHEVALDLIERRDLGALLKAIVTRAGALVGTAHGYLYTVDSERNRATIVAGTGLYVPMIGFTTSRGQGLAGRVWETGTTIAIDDYQSWSGALEAFTHRPVHAVVGVPLWSEGEISGILGLALSEVERRFGPDELEALERLSQLASLAIEGARLRQAAEEELDQRRAVEAALRTAETRYRSLVERIPAVIEITALDEEATPMYVSPQIETLLGYATEEWMARPGLWLSIVDPEDRDEVVAAHQRQVEGLGPFVAEYRARHRDGRTIWIRDEAVVIFDEAGQPSYAQGIMFDVSRSKEIEEQLRQAQKMEAVGQLAAGIAHDFNNALTIIGGHAQLLSATIPAEDPMYTDVMAIEAAAARAGALTAQLLAFGRRRRDAPQVLDLGAVVEETASLLRRLIGENIRLVTTVAPDGPHVLVDRVLLEQVLINLVVNARDAMPDGGELTVEVDRAEADRADARKASRAGGVARLRIRDTGIGMDTATQERIFLPFFTTKEPGRGTGLGLATAWATIEAAGGLISVDSTLGRGTTFTVVLPAAEFPVQVPGGQVASENTGGSGRILVVEDEPSVARLAREVLIRAGYSVTVVGDGKAALDMMAAGAGDVDLVLTDLVMPGMSGAELVKRMRAVDPEIRILVMTGYADDRMLDGLAAALVPKPFTPEGLRSMVREALDTAGRSATA